MTRPTTALIELGEDWSLPDEPEPPARDRHRWLLLIGLVAVLAAAGSVPAQSGFREIGTVPEAGNRIFALTTDAVDVIEQSTVRGSTISSYETGTTQRRWRTRLPGPANELIPDATHRILISGGSRDTAAGPRPGFVAALDAGTGRTLWTRDSTQLVDAFPSTGTTLIAGGNRIFTTSVESVDSRTGASRWSFQPDSTGAIWSMAIAAQPSGERGGRAIVLSGDTVTMLDEATGDQIASHQVGLPSIDQRQDARPPRLYAIGTHAIVAYEARFHTVFIGYDLGTLTLSWQVTMPTETGFLADCGTVVCAGTGILTTCRPVRCEDIDSFLYGLDPNTAKMLWTSRGWSYTGQLVRIGTPASQLTRVVAFNREPPGSLLARDAVIEAESGQLAYNLITWVPVTAAIDPAGALLVSAPDDAYHSWFSLFDPSGAALLPLGRLPVAGRACQTNRAQLVCPTLDGGLTVWHYRP